VPANGVITVSSRRCLKRNFQPAATDARLSWNVNVVPLLNLTIFRNFTAGFDADVGLMGNFDGVYDGGHFGVGGEVRHPLPIIRALFVCLRSQGLNMQLGLSTNDLLFYMYHENLDHI
jgi:hypothetical protein